MAAKVVMKTGEMVWTWGMLYKAVFQTVLLYGSNIWVVMGVMLKVLEELHHWADRRIVGMTDWRTMGGKL